MYITVKTLYNNKLHKNYPLTCWKFQIKSPNHYMKVINTTVTHNEVLKVCNDSKTSNSFKQCTPNAK